MTEHTHKAVEHLRGVWDDRARRDAQFFIKCDLDDQSPDAFFASGEQDVAEFIDPLLEKLPSRGCAVDIGCGIGRLTRALGDRFDHVLGVDISPEMIAQAHNVEPAAAEHIDFQVVAGDGGIPMADGAADLVFSYIVFQHLPRLDLVHNYLAECHRVLSKGGYAKIQINTRRRTLLQRLQVGLVPSDRVPLVHRKPKLRLDPHDHMGVVLSERQCRAAASKAGFVVEALEPLGEQYTWMTLRKPD